MSDIFSRIPPVYQIVSEKNELWLIHYNLTSLKNPAAALIIQIDLESFSEYLRNAAQEGNGNLYIVNSANELICSSQEDTVVGMEFSIPNEQNYLILRDTDDSGARTYISAMPMSVFTAKINHLYLFYIINMMVCMPLCLLLSFYF